ncbi:MAG: hypothetical protein JW995_00210 [Melioribacteraceae bacterium]|nr:hypothetical protein [Melioribacteraceae bacterium]
MKDLFKLVAGLSVVIIVIIFGALYFESFVTTETLIIQINKIEEKTNPEGESYYLIHTPDEVFENRNNYFHQKENAVELAEQLKDKRKYEVEVVGFGLDLPLFMEHRNIVNVIREIEIYTPKPRRLSEID